jgi:hypothetical protein
VRKIDRDFLDRIPHEGDVGDDPFAEFFANKSTIESNYSDKHSGNQQGKAG